MIRSLVITAAAAAAVLLALGLLPIILFLPASQAPTTAAPAPVLAPTGTVASLRSLARRRGLRSAGGRPIAQARRADLLAALATY